MPNKIEIQGSFAPTEIELRETTVFLENLIKTWPDEPMNKQQQAVDRFAAKLKSLALLSGCCKGK